MLGTVTDPGSLAYIENQIDLWSDLPIEIEELREERRNLVKAIYGKSCEIKRVYEDMYAPVQHFINSNKTAKDRFLLQFDVALVDAGFAESFFGFVSHGLNGSFCGAEQGETRLCGLLERHDFNSEQGVLDFLEEVFDCLSTDRRTGGKYVIASQLKKGRTQEDLYDFLYGIEYIQPRYGLQMAGKGLDQLFPGEKGSLLLVFYLLVDQNDSPLIIDQPEENLDNETVVNLLVPCMKEAKRKRQIFIVTHNPNMAVVCDADQVISATHDVNKISYVAGSIEDPVINVRVQDKLEGTKSAFNNRRSKYQ